jgi:hypothetical protein
MTMPNSKRNTRSEGRNTHGRVTIAFKRTFLEGDLEGISIHGMTRQVTTREAARLVAGSGFGRDGDGSRAVDNHIRVVAPGTDPLVLEKYELTRENFLLMKILARMKRRVKARREAIKLVACAA